MNGEPSSRRSPAYRSSGLDTWNPGHNRWAIAGTVTIATFMEVLDSSVVNVALPHIASGMSVAEDQSTWVLTAYLISSAIILPMSGWLAARFGRKRYYMSSVVWFSVGSLLCGIAPSLGSLVVFRVLQGAGGAGLGPSEQAILADTFAADGTAMAFAAYGVVIVLAPTLGPTLGGYLTDHYGWRWVFFINLPIGIASLFLTQRMIEDPPYLKLQESAGITIDYIGIALLAIGLGSLQIVLDRGQRYGWLGSRFIVALIAVAAIALLAVAIWEWFPKTPVIDLRLFKRRTFAIASFMMFILAAVLYGTLLMLPEFVQLLLDYTAQQAGSILWPSALAIIPLLLMVGWLLSVVDARWLIALGFALTAVATFHIAYGLGLSISPRDATMFQVYQSVGLSFLFVPIITVAYADMPAERNGEISSLLAFSRNLGGSCGISFVTTELARRVQYHQSVLTAEATLYKPDIQRFLRGRYGALSHAGAHGLLATHLAAGELYQIIERHAAVLSYIDVFWIFALVCVCMTPLAFLMKPRTPS